jgi:transcriptional regulator with XRE-family HTH domain
MNKVSKFVKDARIAKGYTQEELSEKAKLTLRTIQRIENQESIPRGSTLNLICDALEIDNEEILNSKNTSSLKTIIKRSLDIFFIIILNLILVSVTAYLTIDSSANTNSRFAGLIISIILPLLIVFLTNISAVQRLVKYGLGYIIFGLLVITLHGFPTAFSTALVPCLIFSIAILQYGDRIIHNFKVRHQ